MRYPNPVTTLAFLIWTFSAIFFYGCNSSTNTEEGQVSSLQQATASPAEIPLVTLHTATEGRLPLRRQANGKLRARREVVVKSRTGGLVTEAPVEGTYYKEGNTLLTTDPEPLDLALDRAIAALAEANFRHDDLLLRLTANLSAEDTVTNLARRNILIQSGVPTAEVALREAEFQLSLARLPAPFGGRAADVKVQSGQQINPGEEVCTLIDLASLEAEFSLLEQELGELGPGTKVTISPVARPDLKISAQADIINPKVEAGGLLRVRARLKGKLPDGLYPGMNVTVLLEQAAPTAVLVPKSAVVIRSGRDLVFTYAPEEGRAKWQYVTVGYTNDEQVAITEGVATGQQVIVNGNLTLDHDVVVRVE